MSRNDQNQNHTSLTNISVTEQWKSRLLTLWQMVQSLTIFIISIPTIFISTAMNYLTKSRSLEGQVILITGSANGLGRQLAREFAKNGCKLACVDLNETSNKETVKQLNEKYLNCAKAYTANVIDVKQIESMAKEVEKDWQNIDILVNNAGIIPNPGTIIDLTDEEIEGVIKINLLCHFKMVRQFLPNMIKRNNGHIVAISSMSSMVGFVKAAPYCASKHAVNGFMLTLEDELKEITNNRIRTTTVCPYFINTNPMYSKYWKLRKPELSVEYTAEEIVRAVKENQTIITVPRYMYGPLHIIKLLPSAFRNFILKVYSIQVMTVDEEVKKTMPAWRILQDSLHT